MSMNGTFSPLADSVTLSVGATSVPSVLPGDGGDSCFVYNDGTAYVLVVFGRNTAPVASLNNTPIPAKTAVVLGLPPDVTHVAAIGSTPGPATVIFQRGAGV